MSTNIANQVTEIIGGTPMIRLENLSPPDGATIFAKMEYLNPGGSVKDRIALSMLQDAEASGTLKPGMTVVEATSGNTGIGLAMLCAKMNYRLVLTMPETMSFERRALVTRYGAEVVITPGSGDMDGAKARAQEIGQKNENCIELKQFDNPANPKVHRENTGPEIVKATGGKIVAFVAGIGTGGTITGVGEVLKGEVPDVALIGVEPANSAVLNGKSPGPHAIEGIGAGFVPSILNREILDDVLMIEDREAFDTTEALAREEALLVGISSGANVLAAQRVASKLSSDDVVVTVLCDTGTRYFSIEEYFQRDEVQSQSALL
ncbi:TPA: cysteine synthase A [Candidatus Latescibacteria bacterium]|nr:cysteine synthase A [Candidatus Latescibacterota bacterium]